MNESLRHRGPDDEGTFFDEHVSLGHTRLSLLDLSPAGHQPMSDTSTHFTIVYNGELYNFRELRDAYRGVAEQLTPNMRFRLLCPERVMQKMAA
jgi:asparagine synthase (glutamine-hydrolysing)